MAGLLKIVAVCMATVILSLSAQAQQSKAARRCHVRIAELQNVEFGEKTTKELQEMRTFLRVCVVSSHEALSKLDLASAALELDSVRDALDRSSNRTLASDLATKDAVLVKVSPLEPGLTFDITFAGEAHHCEAASTEMLQCKYFKVSGGSYAFRYFIAALIVQISPAIPESQSVVGVAPSGKQYVIGCVEGDHTCLRPVYGNTWAGIEGGLIRFPAWNVQWSDPKNGRNLDEQPALFTFLGRLTTGR